VSQPQREPKTCWHPLSLQQLAPDKFIGIVNNILSGRLSMLAEPGPPAVKPSCLSGMGLDTAARVTTGMSGR